jgi:uncharacterized membrane protein AbrB (regulator of aidB expression)
MKITSVLLATSPILIVLILQAYLMLHLSSKIDHVSLQFSTLGTLPGEMNKIPTLTPPKIGCETDAIKNQIEIL